MGENINTSVEELLKIVTEDESFNIEKMNKEIKNLELVEPLIHSSPQREKVVILKTLLDEEDISLAFE